MASSRITVAGFSPSCEKPKVANLFCGLLWLYSGRNLPIWYLVRWLVTLNSYREGATIFEEVSENACQTRLLAGTELWERAGQVRGRTPELPVPAYLPGRSVCECVPARRHGRGE